MNREHYVNKEQIRVKPFVEGVLKNSKLYLFYNPKTKKVIYFNMTEEEVFEKMRDLSKDNITVMWEFNDFQEFHDNFLFTNDRDTFCPGSIHIKSDYFKLILFTNKLIKNYSKEGQLYYHRVLTVILSDKTGESIVLSHTSSVPLELSKTFRDLMILIHEVIECKSVREYNGSSSKR